MNQTKPLPVQESRKRRRPTGTIDIPVVASSSCPGCDASSHCRDKELKENKFRARNMRVTATPSYPSLSSLLIFTVWCGGGRSGMMCGRGIMTPAAVAAWASSSSFSKRVVLPRSLSSSSRWSMMALDSRELRFFHKTDLQNPTTMASTTSTLSTNRAAVSGFSHQGGSSSGSSAVARLEHDFSQFMLSGNTALPLGSTAGGTATATLIPLTLNGVTATATTDELPSTCFFTSTRYESLCKANQAMQTKTTASDGMVYTTTQHQVYSSIERSSAVRTAAIARTNRLYSQNSRSSSPQPQTGYGPSICLTPEETELFDLLRRVRSEMGLHTTLRVAGGWVRDKLLATPEFRAYHRVFAVGSCATETAGTTARLTSKFRRARNAALDDDGTGKSSSSRGGSGSMGRQGTKVLISPPRSRLGNDDATGQPVDIDIALDDMLGREFADRLNEYLTSQGQDTVTVGMVLKNPEKSKHLETATMKVGPFWIDFVNLRAEEYTQDSRIPDLMRIGTADEDAYRRDLTINSLFYNINTGQVEDWTGRGFQDLRKGVISTPLHPLTTLLDDPLRVLRSIRFAARLRFTMDDDLVDAAKTSSVAEALSQKVSRERVGGELDLMLRSPDPVGAVRLLINLKLVGCVFPIAPYYKDVIAQQFETDIPPHQLQKAVVHVTNSVFQAGLELLSTAHDHLADCRWSPPLWCVNKRPVFGASELRLIDDEEARRLLWYAAFLKPQYDEFKTLQAKVQASARRATSSSTTTPPRPPAPSTKKANRSIVAKMLVDELKRPARDAESIESIIKAADDFTQLLDAGCDVSATMILLSNIQVTYTTPSTYGDQVSCDLEDDNDDACVEPKLVCSMNGRSVDSEKEDDPVWEHAMEFRLLCSKVLQRVGPLWRAALFLAISEELVKTERMDGIEYAIEGDVIDESQDERRQGVLERFDTFAAALQQIGLIGIWNEKPMADGNQISSILPCIPKGPAFREVMDEQMSWATTHPGAGLDGLTLHLKNAFPDYANSV